MYHLKCRKLISNKKLHYLTSLNIYCVNEKKKTLWYFEYFLCCNESGLNQQAEFKTENELSRFFILFYF